MKFYEETIVELLDERERGMSESEIGREREAEKKIDRSLN